MTDWVPVKFEIYYYSERVTNSYAETPNYFRAMSTIIQDIFRLIRVLFWVSIHIEQQGN